METIIEKLVDVHGKLAIALELDQQKERPPSDDLLARGWVQYPLSDADVERLESIAGFTLSPIVRALFQTRGAMPSFEVDAFGVGQWAGSWTFEVNQDIANARAEYGWDLPKMVRLDAGEDFYAVTEEGEVVFVCSNEGNIERRHGAIEGWLGRYVDSAAQKAADPDAYLDDDEAREDPEAEYD